MDDEASFLMTCSSSRRVRSLQGHLGTSGLRLHDVSSSPGNKVSIIGEDFPAVTVIRRSTSASPLVPHGFLHQLDAYKNQEVLGHLRFLMQKDCMGQDSFLLGPPGQTRRSLALAYCELAGREVEFVSITQDTTVSDLKQRREIQQRTALYVDGPAVRAAIHGRVLVLEGVQSAERNLLSVLNNLLENREMQLEDGRFLTNPKRYDVLKKELQSDDGRLLIRSNTGKVSELVRVSDHFRVIALGLPCPEFDGNGLDPPFRSRFQALHVAPIAVPPWCEPSTAKVEALAHVGRSLRAAELQGIEGLPARWVRRSQFPQELHAAVALLRQWPFLPLRFVFGCVYPTPCLAWFSPLHRRLLLATLVRHAVLPEEALTAPPPTDTPAGGDSARRALSGGDDDGLVLGTTEARNDALWIGPHYSARCGVSTIAAPITRCARREGMLRVQLESGLLLEAPVPMGPLRSTGSDMTPLPYQRELLHQMMLAHAAGRDFTLIGRRGTGKSALVRAFAQALGYRVHLTPMYRDMTSQSLLARRSTLPNGDTVWLASPLLTAALVGGLAVLDGLEQVPPATLSALQSLLAERRAALPDGRVLLPAHHPCFAEGGGGDGAAEPGVLRTHPAFRVICLARPEPLTGTRSRGTSWLSPQVCVTFAPFLWVRELRAKEEGVVLADAAAAARAAPELTLEPGDRRPMVKRALEPPPLLALLIELTRRMRARTDDEARAVAGGLSTRQLVRLARRLATGGGEAELAALVANACLWRFLPPLAQEALLSEMRSAGFCDDVLAALGAEEGGGLALEGGPPDVASLLYFGGDEAPRGDAERLRVEVREQPPDHRATATAVAAAAGAAHSRLAMPVVAELRIGAVRASIHAPRSAEDAALVPQTLFYENVRQSRTLAQMVLDFGLGEHLLLIGNQGVGKNKLADRFLELLRLPRQYIQLDRDTTVGHLTSQPVVKDGIVTYEDSALVVAAKRGHVLVVDEADKAPTYVTSVLKSLLADGEMLLADGRRLTRHAAVAPNGGREGVEAEMVDPEVRVSVHEDFRMIVLANRPGFPFLGNDFFAEMGDVFACYVVDNPDPPSELSLLLKYAPNVPREMLHKLITAFGDLRALVDKGTIRYPYSTRELVNVVRHIEAFPQDGMASILKNVFDFDQYSKDEKRVLTKLFHKHGIPIGLHDAAYRVKLGNQTPLPPPIRTETWHRAPQLGGACGALGAAGAHRCATRVSPLEWRSARGHGGVSGSVRGAGGGREPGSAPAFPYTYGGGADRERARFGASDSEFPMPAVPTDLRKARLARFEGRSTLFDELLFSFSQ